MADSNPFMTDSEQEQIVREVIDKFLIPHFLSLGMDATGEWRKNLEARKNAIWGRKYTAQLVNGRKAGTYAPIEPLKRWAMAKFGMGDREALGMAFAVSKTLKEKGSRYYQQGGTDLLEVLNSQPVVDYINNKAKGFMSANVRLNITREFKNAFK